MVAHQQLEHTAVVEDQITGNPLVTNIWLRPSMIGTTGGSLMSVWVQGKPRANMVDPAPGMRKSER